MFGPVRATAAEVTAARAGDELVAADVVMDRGMDLPATPEQVWPWLVQLGKGRSGWYFTRRMDRLIPPSRRSDRHLEARWQQLAVGDVIPDYGGADATFTVAGLDPPSVLLFTSVRGRASVSWALTLTATGPASSRLHLRLRIGPIRRPWLARTLGDWFDGLTISWLAGGLRERV